MGEPVECEHADPDTGNSMQQTTTGLALYRRDTNTPMFTNGREHWALTPDGVTHWSGWHASADPLEASAQPDPEEPQASAGTQVAPASVEAVTIVEVFDDGDPRLVIHRDESPYLVRTDSACAMHQLPAGTVAFVVTPDELGEPANGLITTLDGLECRITDVQPL